MLRVILRVVFAVAALLILVVVGMELLTSQPKSPVANFPPPADRDEAWRQDLAFLRDEFTALDRSFTDAAAHAFAIEVNRLHDQASNLTDNEIIAGITHAVALSKNGHTRAYLMRNENYLPRLPIRFYWFSDGLWVVRALDEHAQTLGMRVVAINGITPEVLRERLRAYIPGGETWVTYKSTYLLNSPAFLNGIGVVPDDRAVPITFEQRDGSIVTLTLPTLPLDDREEPYEAWRDLSPLSDGNADGLAWKHVLDGRKLPLYLGEPNRATSHHYDENSALLYIQINRNSDDENTSHAEFAEEIQALAKNIAPAAVVFDVRFNTGGSNERTLKITKGIPSWFPSANHFYLVTGPSTFSAGIVSAARVKYFANELASVIGEPAAEDLTTWSEGPRFKLPNSRLQVKAATAWHDWETDRFVFGKTYFSDLFYGVPTGDLAVDIPVAPSFAEYRAGRDPVLEEISRR